MPQEVSDIPATILCVSVTRLIPLIVTTLPALCRGLIMVRRLSTQMPHMVDKKYTTQLRRFPIGAYNGGDVSLLCDAVFPRASIGKPLNRGVASRFFADFF